MAGKSVYKDIIQSNVKQINLSDYPKGVYYVKLYNGNIAKTEKVILY